MCLFLIFFYLNKINFRNVAILLHLQVSKYVCVCGPGKPYIVGTKVQIFWS